MDIDCPRVTKLQLSKILINVIYGTSFYTYLQLLNNVLY